jgi:3-keto-disaccharide hydrolase
MMKPNRILLAGMMALLVLSSGLKAEEKCDKECTKEGWVNLFDGKSLNGWVQHNGTAKYEVADGTIHGTTNEGSPNSFLCTEKLYGNFELEFEVKVHNDLNSGVQIRSQQKNGNGRVNGPQVEIEASGSNGAEAGYVYGEATGRGWLTPESRLKPHKTMKDGGWNKFRVVAKGNRIQTWINGQPIEDLVDEEIYKTHPKGFIGLQVHGIGKGKGPFDVAWKNIRIKELK